VQKYIWRALFFIIVGAVLCPHMLMPEAHGLAESTAQDGSNAKAVHELGETGEDVNVGLISAKNTRTTHEAFKDSNGISHAFHYDFTDEDIYEPDAHDTWVAGVVASRGGASHPNDIGVAPSVDIHSAKVTRKKSPTDPNRVISFAWVEDALDSLVNDHNCRVIVTGIQLSPVALPPNGQSQWTLLYDYYAYTHNVIFANASGKDYTNPTVFGDGYNGITTGGLVVTDPDVYLKVGTNSNIGPTVDGRRKPDLVAPSQNQTMPSNGDTSWSEWTRADGATSLSTPHTAGVAALLLGLADDSGEPNDGYNEVIKAVIVNSTFPNILDELGNPTNPADPNNTWDPNRGYGRIDALRAYETLAADRIHNGQETDELKGWAFDTVDPNGHPNDVHNYKISTLKGERLLVTLTWNRRVEWTDKNQNGKINTDELEPNLANLDLIVYEPNNSEPIFSESIYNLEPNDNLEKCDLSVNKTGDYTVKVINKSATETVSYGLAFEVLVPIPGDFYPADYIVDYSDMATVAQQWLLEGENLEADLFDDDNNIVNLPDFAEFANYWLETDARYYQGQ